MSDHSHHSLALVGHKLKISILLTSTIFVVEVAGGILSNSLALLSDAGHVLTDIVALSLSWYGVRQAERPSSARMTFGYHRVGVIVALVNAVSIFALAALIFYEAFQRWQDPPAVNSGLMSAVALVGLSVNLFVAFWLSQESKGNINIRSAFWHAFGDALGSVGVIAGGIVIFLTGYYVVDPLVSVFIGAIITVAAWRILNEGLKVILEAAPPAVSVDEMIDALTRVPGVKSVHDVHLWSITPEILAMSSHVQVKDVLVSQASDIRRDIENMLRRRYRVEHTTLQMECDACQPGTFCQLVLNPDGDEAPEQKS
ncbi:MAG: cation transporter [Chloroflexi bacterium]|nr:cation transporter [Chloroflexota bacterium]